MGRIVLRRSPNVANSTSQHFATNRATCRFSSVCETFRSFFVSLPKMVVVMQLMTLLGGTMNAGLIGVAALPYAANNTHTHEQIIISRSPLPHRCGGECLIASEKPTGICEINIAGCLTDPDYTVVNYSNYTNSYSPSSSAAQFDASADLTRRSSHSPYSPFSPRRGLQENDEKDCSGWPNWDHKHLGYYWLENEWVQTTFYLLPLIILVIISLFGVKSYVSLPVAAFLMYLVRLIFFNADPPTLHWCWFNGILGAFQPTVIVFGAVVMFGCMEVTGCTEWMIANIKKISKGNPVVEIMLMPYTFGYLIEGCAGFGTPAALSAPVLRELGHAELLAVVLSLCMNSFPVPLGAVGTPIWYGLSGVTGADDDMFMIVANKTAFIMFISSPFIAPCILFIALRWKYVLKNLVFITLATTSCTATGYLLTLGGYGGSTTYEFGSLVGGCVGFLVTAVLAYFGLGLTKYVQARDYPKKAVVGITEEGSDQEGDDRLNDEDSKVDQGKIDEEVNTLSPETEKVGEHANEAPHDETFSVVAPGIQKVGEHSSEAPPDVVDPVEGDARSLDDGGKDLSLDVEEVEEIEEKTSGGVLTEEELQFSFRRMLAYTFPFYISVLILVLTRIKELEIKGLLQSKTPTATIPLNGLGDFKFSPALVLQWMETFGVNGGTVFETFYIPFILPFLVAGFFTCLIHWGKMKPTPWRTQGRIYKKTFQRVILPFVALIGANAFSQMLRKESHECEDAPTTVIGKTLAGGLSYGWIPLAPFLGVLGAFFSGSASVSNLTFGEIQRVAACDIGVSPTSMLALQTLGAAIGNMTCIFNILSVKTILGNDQPEGYFLKRTAPIMLLFWLVSTAFGGPLLFAVGWCEGINFSGSCDIADACPQL